MAETTERTDGDRAELSQAAAELNLMEFWEERANLELLRPRKGAMPCLWRWRDIEPRLLARPQQFQIGALLPEFHQIELGCSLRQLGPVSVGPLDRLRHVSFSLYGRFG